MVWHGSTSVTWLGARMVSIAGRTFRDPTIFEITFFVCIVALFFAINTLWQWRGYRTMFALVERLENEKQQRRYYYFSGDSESGEESGDEESLILLNRTPTYLRDTAISFARSYDLSESVSALYAHSSSQEMQRVGHGQVGQRKKKKKRRLSRQFSPRLSTDFSRWDTQKKIEPVFEMPIDRQNFWLSSPFGPRREPRGRRGFHFGIDMAAVRGTLVKAAGDGVVVYAGQMPGYGNVIVIKHDGKFKTRYAHLSKISTSYGAQVTTGQVIGKVGSTGNSRASGKTRDASHLHFDVEMYGKRVNPFYFFK